MRRTIIAIGVLCLASGGLFSAGVVWASGFAAGMAIAFALDL